MVPQPSKTVPSEDLVVDITSYLRPELQKIEQILRDLIDSDSPLIREVGEYVCLATGKKLRPMITLLVSRAFGPVDDELVRVAAALEAVHVATLLHDDVIDKATMRRGRPSVNARWGDDVAVLMADFLYAAAFDLALHHLGSEPLRLLCQVTRKMCEGEMFQIERRGQWLTTDEYLRLISCKTAYLFSACSALGGLAAGFDVESIARSTAFGLDFGLAFQITDDTLDYVATDAHWGKSVGMDLATGKQTLPLILALEQASEEERRQFDALMNNGRDMSAVRRLLDRYDALDRSLDHARKYARQSLGHLEGFEVRDESAHEFLLALPEYVVNRRY